MQDANITTPNVSSALKDLVDHCNSLPRRQWKFDWTDHVEWDRCARRLMLLAAKFALALEGAGGLNELAGGILRLDELTKGNPDFEAARQAANRAFAANRSTEQSGDFFPQFDNHLAYALLPIQIEAATGLTQILLSEHPKGPKHTIFNEWLNQAENLRRHVELEDLWGQQLIFMCWGTYHEDFAPLVGFEADLLLLFHDLDRVADGIKAAAIAASREYVGTPAASQAASDLTQVRQLLS